MSWGSADAVIVGGGVIGCSIAYHLAGRGAKVVLVERDALGSQSTGKCAGGVRRQFSSEPNVVMPQLSIRLLAGLDVLNVFQVTGLDPVHEIYFMEPSPAKKGDFFEFFAEIDLLCAISTCPSGDLSEWGWGPDQSDPVATCRPLGVEVYDLDEGLLEGWTPPQPVRVKSVYGAEPGA